MSLDAARTRSPSEKRISERRINNLRARTFLYLIDSTFAKIYLRQAPSACATSDAELLGIQAKVGTLEPGKLKEGAIYRNDSNR
jgi:hypothetical protein